MHLLESPFYLLKTTTRDSRSRLVELADDASLSLDPDACAAARNVLTGPRTRLTAEVAWLPGASTRQLSDVLECLLSAPDEALAASAGLSALCRFNVAYTVLSTGKSLEHDAVRQLIEELAAQFEAVDCAQVRVMLNEDRQVAGFTLISDWKLVEQELEARRRLAQDVMVKALDRLPSKLLVSVVTDVAEDQTDIGDEAAPRLVEDVVEAYRVRTLADIADGKRAIEELISEIRNVIPEDHNGEILGGLIERLGEITRIWDEVAQPLQVIQKSRGLPHEESCDLAESLRGLAIALNNEHDHTEHSHAISEMLQEVFAEVPEVIERVEDDLVALEEILDSKKKRAESAEAFARAITYEAQVGGLILKDLVSLSPKGIRWRGRTMTLPEITSIRWGGIRDQYRTSYKIVCESKGDSFEIVTRDHAVYDALSTRLWRAVGVRLITEFFDALKSGERFHFGNMLLEDAGVHLPRTSIFSSNKTRFLRWQEVKKAIANGNVTLTAVDDDAYFGYASLIETPNAPILNVALDVLWKRGGARLSGLAEQ